MADEQTLNHIMNEYEELRISAANERKKRIEEVNKKIPRVAEIDREIFQCGMENTKRIFKQQISRLAFIPQQCYFPNLR